MNRKVVYITGGSGGIGLASARAFLEEGCSVALFARNLRKLEEAAARLNTVYEGRVTVFGMDVTSRKEVDGRIAEAVSSAGPPDIVLTCAGTAYPDYFERIGQAEYVGMVDVNLTGTWNTIQAVLPHMKPGSAVVTVSSVAGFVGTFGYTAYAATKFAVIGLSEALRGELKPRGISVSVLCPPDTDTEQLRQENLTKPPETRAISGNVKVMQPEAVARALLKGIRKRRFLIIPGAGSRMVYAATRLFPALVRRVMDGDVRRVQHHQEKKRTSTDEKQRSR